MDKCITYFENGERFETFKMKVRNVVKVLVKKEGKPFKVVIFHKLSGKILDANHVY